MYKKRLSHTGLIIMLTVMLALFINSVIAQGATTPTNLSPTGYIANLRPTFTWTTGTQTKFQFHASTNSSFTNIPYDTGTITSSIKSFTPPIDFYEGSGYWRVRVFDGLTWSNWSNPASSCIDITSPGTPGTPSTASPTRDTTPTWTWSAASDSGSGISGYYVKVGTTPGGSDILGETWIGNTTSYTPSQGYSNGTYYLSVRAKDNAGNLGNYVSSSGCVIDTTPPSAPASVTAPSITNDNTPTVSWSASTDNLSGIMGYYIKVGTTPGGSEVRPKSWVGNITSFTPTDGLPDGTYYAAVMAADNAGNEGPYKDSSSCIIDNTPPGIPGRPSTTSPTGDTTPTWTWSAASDNLSGISGYYIKVGTTSGGSNILAETWVGNTTTYTPSQGYAGGTYYLSVRAKDKAGNVGSYVASSGCVIDTTPPSAPGSITVPSTTTDNTPTVSWSASTDNLSGVAGYYAKVGTTSGGSELLPETWFGNITSYTSTESIPDGIYYFSIKAKDNVGNIGSYKTSPSCTIDTTPPSTPGTPSTTSPTNDTTPTWTWSTASDNLSGVSGYYVKVGTTSGGSNILAETWVGNTTTYTPSQGYAGGTYYLSVRAKDKAGNIGSYVSSYGCVIDTIPPSTPGLPGEDYLVSDNTPTISWNPASDANEINGYYIKVGTTSGGSNILAETWIGNTLSYTPTQAYPDGSYYVSVKAQDNAGNIGAYATSGKCTIDTLPPGNPGTPSTASPTKDTTPTWTWSAASDASGINGYYVKVGTTQGGSNILAETWVGNTLSYTPSQGYSSGTYYLSVRAKDNAGNLGSYVSSSGCIIDTTPPSAPGLDGGNHVTNDNTPTIYWAAASDANGISGYYIKIGTTSGGSEFLTETWVGDTLSYTPSQACPDGIYYVSVKAKDNAGNTGSYATSGKCIIDTSPPSRPGIPIADKTPASHPTWTWEPATDLSSVVKYYIKIGTTPCGSDVVNNAAIEGGVCSYSLPDDIVTSDGEYYIQVKAEDQFGHIGEYSDICITEIDNLPPAPIISTLENPTLNTRPIWTWNPVEDPNGIAGYHVRILTFDEEVVRETFITDTSYQPATPLESNNCYVIEVRARDANTGEFGPVGSLYTVIGTFSTPSPSAEQTLANVLTTSTAIRAQYDINRNAPIADYIGGIGEGINTENGNLTVEQTDLVLPGRGGFDFVLKRVYNTSAAIAGRIKVFWLDGEQSVFGGADVEGYIGGHDDYNHYEGAFGLGIGWSFNLPSVESISYIENDYQKFRRYLHMGDGTVYPVKDMEDFVDSLIESDNKTYLFYPYLIGPAPVQGAAYTLVHKSGIKYYFSEDYKLLCMTDTNSNIIQFQYNVSGMISKIIDSVNREINFIYDGTTLTRIEYGDKRIEYIHIDGRVPGKKVLSQVKELIGSTQRVTSYDYEYFNLWHTSDIKIPGETDYHGRIDNRVSYNLSRIEYPSGGYRDYSYEVEYKNFSASGFMQYTRVKERSDHNVDGGSESEVGKRVISYSQNLPDGYPTYKTDDEIPSDYTYWTKSTDSMGTETISTYNNKHLMISKEIINNDTDIFYHTKIEYTYDTDTKLPIKEITTKFKSSGESGDKSALERRMYYDSTGYCDLVAEFVREVEFDSYGNPVGYETISETLYGYDQKYHKPSTILRRKNENEWLREVYEIDSDNGNITEEEVVLVKDGGTPVKREMSLDYNLGSDLWEYDSITIVVPGIVSEIDVTVEYINSLGLRYDIEYRKIGTDEWKLGDTFSISGQSGTRVSNIIMQDGAGIYEIKVTVVDIPLFDSFTLKNISWDEYEYIDSSQPVIKREYSHDEYGNVTEKRELKEDGTNYKVTRYEYDGAKVTKYSSSENYDGAFLTKAYSMGVKDADGYLVNYSNSYSSEAPGVVPQYFEYDCYGRKIASIDGRGNRTTYEYDLVNRLVSETYPAVSGVVSSKSYEYDDVNNRVTITDENSNKTRMNYTSLGQLRSMEKLIGGVWREIVRYTYDSEGRKASESIRLDENGGAGYTTTYSYDGGGRLILTTFPDDTPLVTSDNPTQKIEYDDALLKKTVYNELGDKIEYIHDPLGRVIEEWKYPGPLYDNDEYVTKYSYDMLGNKILVETDRGSMLLLGEERYNVTTYTYGIFKDKPILANHPGDHYASELYEYYPDGNLKAKIIDYNDSQKPDKALVTYEYDDAGRLIKETDALGRATKYFYDGAGNKIKVRNALGKEIQYGYDERGRLISERDPLNHTTYYGYDGAGNKVSVTEPLNNPTTYEYDERGLLVRETNPKGDYVRYTYDLAGNKTAEYRGGIGKTEVKFIEFEYDARNRLVRQTDTISLYPVQKTRTISYEYDAAGNNTRIIDYNGNVVEFVFDALGRKSRKIAYVTVNKGTPDEETREEVEIWKYDGLNNLIEEIDPGRYDGSTPVEDYDITITSPGYNPTTDQYNHTKRYTYDEGNKLRSVRDGRGYIVTYSYDEEGNKTETLFPATDKFPQGTTNRFGYDALNRNNYREDALGNTESWVYNEVGWIISKSDRNGETITYEYYDDGRLKKEKDSSGNTLVEYTYDAAGREKSVSNSYGTNAYDYDELGRLLSETDPDERSTTYQYDYDYATYGSKEIVTDQFGNQMVYWYDLVGRLYRLDDNKGGTTRTTLYEYDASGNRTALIYPNDTKTIYEYDEANRLIYMANKRTSTGAIISEFAYTHYPGGNLRTKVDSKGLTKYAYDQDNRLRKIVEPDGKITTYEYDELGNRIAKKENGQAVATYTYDAANRIESIWDALEGTSNYEYDDNGNQISDGKATFVYDIYNRLKDAYLPSGRVSFTYDGNGTRRVKQVFSTLGVLEKHTEYLYENGNIIYELDLYGNVKYRNVHGINQIAREDSQGNYSYYIYNGHGDTVSLRDSSGNLVYLTDDSGSQVPANYYYDPFGILTEGVALEQNPYLYCGMENDPETGYYLMGARYYDPKIARFITEDTYLGDDFDPLSLHLYTYCANEPLMHWDTTGHMSESILMKPEYREALMYLKNSGALDYEITYYDWGCLVDLGNGLYVAQSYKLWEYIAFEIKVGSELPGLGKKIVIDPGHGGLDPGTSNPNITKFTEKDYTIVFSIILGKILEELGFEVIYTRENDMKVELNRRAQIANSVGADLFISIHLNGNMDDTISGLEIYVPMEGQGTKERRVNSEKVGKYIEMELRKYDASDNPIMFRKPVVRNWENYAVLRKTQMPAILIELGYISNKDDISRLIDGDYVHKLITGIVNGVLDFFK